MKRVSLSFAVAVSCGAFLLGAFLFRADTDIASKSAQATGDQHLPVDPLEASRGESEDAETGKALTDLRIAHARLEKELAATKQKFKQAETAMARYESVHENLVERGDLSIQFPRSRFAIPETLHEFLKLDEAIRQQMDEAVERVFADVRDWERSSAELLEQADGRITYRIPGAEKEFSKELNHSLNGILSDADRELVVASFKNAYVNLAKPREVSFTFLDHENPDMISYKLEMSELRPDGSSSGRSSSTSVYPKEHEIKVDRWSHLFTIE